MKKWLHMQSVESEVSSVYLGVYVGVGDYLIFDGLW